MSDKAPEAPRARHRWGARLDRAITLLIRLGGRLVARPSERLLHELTGRSKGGVPEDTGPGFAALLRAGRAALADGRCGEALVYFSQAAALEPGDPWPWHGRGDALQLSGQHEDALAAYREALARDPDSALSHGGAGNALESLGRPQEAAAAWRLALAGDPSLAWAREGLSRVEGGPKTSDGDT